MYVNVYTTEINEYPNIENETNEQEEISTFVANGNLSKRISSSS